MDAFSANETRLNAGLGVRLRDSITHDPISAALCPCRFLLQDLRNQLSLLSQCAFLLIKLSRLCEPPFAPQIVLYLSAYNPENLQS